MTSLQQNRRIILKFLGKSMRFGGIPSQPVHGGVRSNKSQALSAGSRQLPLSGSQVKTVPRPSGEVSRSDGEGALPRTADLLFLGIFPAFFFKKFEITAKIHDFPCSDLSVV